MAIRQMISREEYERQPDGVDVIAPSVWNTTQPLYIKTTHEGLVVDMYERNGYDDSDFYAVVWNPDTQQPEHIEYASTRGWTYPNSAAVDATQEVRDQYAAWQAATARAAAAARAARKAQVPVLGSQVRVVRGRLVPQGTEAKVFWFGADRFMRPSRYAMLHDQLSHVEAGMMRVGLRLADGSKVFTNARNVEVLAEVEAT